MSKVAPPRSQSASPRTFFVLLFALSFPFWLLGALKEAFVLPGLPASALMFVCPGLAALILIWRRKGMKEATALLARAFDVRLITSAFWVAAAVLMMPAALVLSYLLMRWAGAPVPDWQFSLSDALPLLLVFFITATAEELGWSGYATEPLEGRHGALGAALILGIAWAVWHIVPLIQAQRSIEWIAWWSIGTIGLRVLIVWTYNHSGGSVFAASLLHAFFNVGWMLFPVHGSHYDPRVTSPIIACMAVAAVIFAPRVRSKAASLAKK